MLGVDRRKNQTDDEQAKRAAYPVFVFRKCVHIQPAYSFPSGMQLSLFVRAEPERDCYFENRVSFLVFYRLGRATETGFLFSKLNLAE
jgi:hypothetical protein